VAKGQFDVAHIDLFDLTTMLADADGSRALPNGAESVQRLDPQDFALGDQFIECAIDLGCVEPLMPLGGQASQVIGRQGGAGLFQQRSHQAPHFAGATGWPDGFACIAHRGRCRGDQAAPAFRIRS